MTDRIPNLLHDEGVVSVSITVCIVFDTYSPMFRKSAIKKLIGKCLLKRLKKRVHSCRSTERSEKIKLNKLVEDLNVLRCLNRWWRIYDIERSGNRTRIYCNGK